MYKIKFRVDGSLLHYKALPVAKALPNKWVLIILNIFSLIAKFVTVKALLALAAICGWSLTRLDVNNAFLHSDLSEEVYISLPPEYHHEREPLPRNAVCKLHKSLYGLKQAPRQWFSKFSVLCFPMVLSN